MTDSAKLKIQKAVYCEELDQTFESLTVAAEKTGCLVSKISLCCKGRANSTNGYHWRYSDETLANRAKQLAEARLSEKLDYWSSISTQVYCVVDDKKVFFNSKMEAAKWWYDNYQPFGPTFNKSTYFKKIQQSIDNKPISTGKNQYDYKEITNIRWFLKEVNNG